MRDTLSFHLVDAFAAGPYAGNPAGVVLGADALDDRQMRAIAREVNASETAFVASGASGAAPRLRWFTPATEVSFCGHATLAAAHVLRGMAGGDCNALRFATSAGELTLAWESLPDQPDGLWWLDMPAPGLRGDNTNPMRTCELLGIALEDLEPGVPIMRTRDDDLILVVQSWNRLQQLAPRMHELGQWSARHRIRGICVATRNTLSKSIQVHSRFFAPAAGVPEDPVTGSVHGPLAALLVIHQLVPAVGGRAALNCLQGEPGGRGGMVRALVERTAGSYRVRIGGACATTISGVVRRPQLEPLATAP
jgi:PhzF family phenazine biosynthesis protein